MKTLEEFIQEQEEKIKVINNELDELVKDRFTNDVRITQLFSERIELMVQIETITSIKKVGFIKKDTQKYTFILKKIDELMEKEDKSEGECFELEELVKWMVKYEDIHYPIENSNEILEDFKKWRKYYINTHFKEVKNKKKYIESEKKYIEMFEKWLNTYKNKGLK